MIKLILGIISDYVYIIFSPIINNFSNKLITTYFHSSLYVISERLSNYQCRFF